MKQQISIWIILHFLIPPYFDLVKARFKSYTISSPKRVRLVFLFPSIYISKSGIITVTSLITLPFLFLGQTSYRVQAVCKASLKNKACVASILTFIPCSNIVGGCCVLDNWINKLVYQRVLLLTKKENNLFVVFVFRTISRQGSLKLVETLSEHV